MGSLLSRRTKARMQPTGRMGAELRCGRSAPATIECLLALGLELPVVAGQAPALIATLDTPRGRLELR
jgi:hypothetical protein